MILPRLGDSSTEACPPNVACEAASPMTAANGDAPSTNPTMTDDDGTYEPASRPGPRRYIGVAMVLLMAVLAVVFWVYWTKFRKPKQKAVDADEGSLNSSQPPETTPTPSRRSAFCIGRRKSLSSSPSTSASRSAGAPSKPKTPINISEKEKERKKMLESSMPRGRMIKEVSGGMVMYTSVEAPTRPRRTVPPRRDRDRDTERGSRRTSASVNLNGDWQMEHVSGVRYEARTPPELPMAMPSTPPPR